MTYNSSFSPEKDSFGNKNLGELRRLLRLKGVVSEKEVRDIWQLLKKMQSELELPSIYPIKQHYRFYNKLEEIRNSLNLSSSDFSQLNQFYNEITNLRELLGLPETTSISNIINTIRKESLERLASLEIRYDSLLLKHLLLDSTSTKRDSTKTQERLPLTHDLDLILLEILKAYGPLTRSELVQLAGAPRSTIYDSLQRLITRGFAVEYPKKRSPVGRPVTLFDALI
ncbi:MAG: helix-turn-helix domain-containing protein [Promethearchaeota archaeon]